jgi:hypothetical protein
MISDTEIKENGLRILFQNMDTIEAERFIMLIKTDTFDYTRWRQDLWEDISLRKLYDQASSYWQEQKS